MDYKIVLGIIATVIAFIGYIPYFKNIFKGKTKPHAFSWLIWGAMTAIGFAAQISGNAGPGAWVTGFTSVVTFSIFVLALFKGEKNIVLTDWLSLGGAGLSLLLWYITSGPLFSVILIVIIDAFGFFPTFRKAFHKPFEETAITFFLSGLKFVFAVFALENYSIITWLYPLYLIVANWSFVAMLIIRRKTLRVR